MSRETYRQWLLRSRPSGRIATTDFELRDVPRPRLGNDELLIKTLYLSFDPTQRGWAARETYMPAVELGTPMRATGIGQIVESTSSKHRVGDLVAGLLNWQEYAHVDLKQSQLVPLTPIPGFMDPKLTLAFMITGLTAYFGLLDLGKPRPGDTVVVSGAAGATGSVVGQIAKIRGARAVGIAGGPAKCRLLTEKLGFDAAIDYKNEDVLARLAELCPKGVDVYFDNVGGEILDAVLLNLARGARVVVCGAISQYDKLGSGEAADFDAMYGVRALPNLIVARGSMRGFVVLDFMGRAVEGLAMLNRWHGAGRLIQEIDCQKGFDNIPNTLIRLFEGKNIGKQILEICEPPLPVKKSGLAKVGFGLASRLIALRKG
jgi:hypothetical protein